MTATNGSSYTKKGPIEVSTNRKTHFFHTFRLRDELEDLNELLFNVAWQI